MLKNQGVFLRSIRRAGFTAQASAARVDAPPAVQKWQRVERRSTCITRCSQHAEGADDSIALARVVVVSDVANAIVYARRRPTGRCGVVRTRRTSCTRTSFGR